METTLNTNEKRLHFLAKHKIDSNSKSEKKKKIKSQKKWVKCRELGCFEKREEAKEKRLKKTSK